MFESVTPAFFVVFHPTPITREIRYVDNQLHKVITDDYSTLSPMSFDLLRLVAGGAKVIDDLEDCFGQPLTKHRAAIIELKREQHLEAPPFAAHT